MWPCRVNGAELSNSSVISPCASIVEHLNHTIKEFRLCKCTNNWWLVKRRALGMRALLSPWWTHPFCLGIMCKQPFCGTVKSCPSMYWHVKVQAPNHSNQSPSKWKKRLPPQSHLHFQFGRAHCLPQLVASPAHINARVRSLQISHNQRTEPVFMLLHGHSVRLRHRLLVLKPLHLRLRVT